MPNPSLTAKEKFFPSILADAEFQKNGILFGEDPAIA